MSWISTNNLRRFADKLFHGNLSFGGSVTHNGATTFNGGVKVNTTKAEFAAPVSFTGTTTYKGNEIATKADVSAPTDYVQSVTELNGKVTVTKGGGESTIINLIDTFYPVGSVYISADKSKTKADFPFMQYGTWEEVPANLCLQTGVASEAGKQRSAGLPNITGKIDSVYYQRTGNGTGAFSTNTETVYDNSGHYDNHVPSGFSFDASLSNPIYGSSNTVQPPAYIVRAWVRTA